MSTDRNGISITSEIGRLRSVLLHRPGRELEKLTPQFLGEMLFDDIPWLEKIQEEHDNFARMLEERGCRVFYYRELLEEVLQQEALRERMIEDIMHVSGIDNVKLKSDIRTMFERMNAAELAETCIVGLLKEEVDHSNKERRLSSYIKDEYRMYINPLPNLYFTRDPGTIIGNGIAVNAMKTEARRREAMILHYIAENHPLFTRNDVPFWYDYLEQDSIEGGDILVLGDKLLAVGCSARTSPEAIEKLAERLFRDEACGIEELLVIQIPYARAYMHLDTVFTMVDYDKFTIYPGIEDRLHVFRILPGKDGGLRITPADSLVAALKTSLKLSAVDLIQSGGGDIITAAREQWNDSTNTLAVAPAVVVTYDRNVSSNRTLREHGIEVIEIEGSELVRGRGGPRCMSMPLLRDGL